jgi:hypothetical protein
LAYISAAAVYQGYASTDWLYYSALNFAQTSDLTRVAQQGYTGEENLPKLAGCSFIQWLTRTWPQSIPVSFVLAVLP